MTNAILRGKPDAGNPHVRFDEGEVASAKPRRGSLLYTTIMKMLFGLMKMVLLICWKIVKIICGPMKDSLVHIGKGIWEIIKERHKKRREEKAATAAAAKEVQSAGEQDTGGRLKR